MCASHLPYCEGDSQGHGGPLNLFVISKEEVGSFYNEHFVNLKLDMEKGEGRQFQQKYRVSAFPTLLFLDPEGKVVHKVVGGMDVPNFLKLGKFASSKSNLSAKMDKAYADGERDPAFMAQYVQALAKDGKPRLKIVNEYLSSQKKLDSPENLAVILFGLEEVDSKLFDHLVKYRKKIEDQFGTEVVQKQVTKAAKKTVQKGVEFSSKDLIDEAASKYGKFVPKMSKDFAAQSRMTYYASLQAWDEYLSVAKDYAKVSTEHKFELANTILHKMKSVELLLPWGERWAIEAATKESNEHHHIIAAKICMHNANYAVARSHATKALYHAEKNKSQTVPHINKLLKEIDENLGESKS